jgi:hypothetical protein
MAKRLTPKTVAEERPLCRVSKDESPAASACQFSAIIQPRAETAAPTRTIFKNFAGNVSVTVKGRKGSTTPVTRVFRFQGDLFPNATGQADEA